jgi:predicted NBD/HSP70 family sugar kinase
MDSDEIDTWLPALDEDLEKRPIRHCRPVHSARYSNAGTGMCASGHPQCALLDVLYLRAEIRAR